MPRLNNIFKKSICTLALISACAASWNACADIVISGTRIIYPQTAKDVTVNLENRGTKPLLIQSWIDDGRDTTNPQEIKLPFIITPPVTRIDPHKGQAIRVTWLGQALPADRESLLWFNVLEVPPKSKDAGDHNLLQLAFRTRIKLFFRPTGLPGSPADAVKNLKWTIKKENSGTFLVANNNTVWNISVASVTFKSAGKQFNVDSHSIKPFASEKMKISGSAVPVKGAVNYVTINDFGGTEENQAVINE